MCAKNTPKQGLLGTYTYQMKPRNTLRIGLLTSMVILFVKIFLIERTKKTDSCLVFQVELNNVHVIPSSVYIKILQQFHDLLKLAGFSERKEGMKRRKVTLHSFRRFVKTTISDCVGKEYSEWFLGHAKSSYYVSKPDVRAATYAEKCMKYLTFLDYTTLEAAGKNIEAKLSEKEKEILLLRQRDSMNTDAIATLSDQMTKILQEIEVLKKQK